MGELRPALFNALLNRIEQVRAEYKDAPLGDYAKAMDAFKANNRRQLDQCSREQLTKLFVGR